jgi:hypothetical protein
VRPRTRPDNVGPSVDKIAEPTRDLVQISEHFVGFGARGAGMNGCDRDHVTLSGAASGDSCRSVLDHDATGREIASALLLAGNSGQACVLDIIAADDQAREAPDARGSGRAPAALAGAGSVLYPGRERSTTGKGSSSA